MYKKYKTGDSLDITFCESNCSRNDCIRKKKWILLQSGIPYVHVGNFSEDCKKYKKMTGEKKMGYVLKINAVGKSNPIYCGKLYGYYDETKLKTYEWLLLNNHLTGNEKFGYGNQIDIVLLNSDLITFLNLYIMDLKLYYRQDNLIQLICQIYSYIYNLEKENKYIKYLLEWV